MKMLVFWISGRLLEVIDYQTGMITDRGSTLFGSRIAGLRVPAIRTNVYFRFFGKNDTKRISPYANQLFRNKASANRPVF